MPAISLVVCLYNERDLLERLLRNSQGCYDDLVVVHDGPDTTDVRGLVEKAGGRFFERPREFQQEPHWPFAWGQARHDWILRLDADEFPSDEMREWLLRFRGEPEPEPCVSGYTCYWPMWDGHKAISQYWPADRFFLFYKTRIRFFGMVEQVPVADGECRRLNLVLRHEPPGRKSHSLGNILLRKRAKQWRECIARSLLDRPDKLCCWRWESGNWPANWECVRRHPWQTAFSQLGLETLRVLRYQWRAEKRLFLVAAIVSPLHQILICFRFWYLRRRRLVKPRMLSVPFVMCLDVLKNVSA